MALRKDPLQLSKLLAYMLGRQPDEFGLVPDPDGYVKIKDLLQAISEEDGWRHVRRQHLTEMLLTVKDPTIEITAHRIRAKARDALPRPMPPPNLPKLLFTCVRRKAHPVVLENGIFPMGRSRVILCASSDMAERMGRRKDPLPVLLTVNVHKMLSQGLVFHQLGDMLYLTETVPVGCFSGPPLAKERTQPQKEAAGTEIQAPKSPGTFLLDLSAQPPAGSKPRGKHRKKEIAWKKHRRRRKNRKDSLWPDL